MKNILIIIPAYNEENMIGKVIADVKKEGYKNILVVDDGSTDKTSEVVKKAGAMMVRHFINRGKGAAMKTGLEAAKILDVDYVITIDGDGQHEPKDIKKLIKKLDDGYEIVLGSRFLSANRIPLFRRLVNKIANLITWIFYGLYVSDTQSGFRAYSKKALSLIKTDSEEYEFDSEIIREIVNHQLKYTEAPIKVYYTLYSQSKTRKQGFVAGLSTIYNLLIKNL